MIARLLDFASTFWQGPGDWIGPPRYVSPLRRNKPFVGWRGRGCLNTGQTKFKSLRRKLFFQHFRKWTTCNKFPLSACPRPRLLRTRSCQENDSVSKTSCGNMLLCPQNKPSSMSALGFTRGLLITLQSKNKTPVVWNAKPVLGVKPKRARYVLRYFFKIDLCSATSMESSRRDLWNNVAKHRSILKNYQSYTIVVLVSHL